MYQHLFRKHIFPVFEEVIKKRSTCKYLEEYENQQWWSLEKLEELQLKKLKLLLAHAYNHVPYYFDLWNRIKFNPNDLSTVKDLEQLPFLTKEIIKENYSKLISEKYKDRYFEKSTGGSTGVPLHFAYSQESYSRRNAVMWRGYTWAGLPPGKKSIYLWGTSLGNVSFKEKIKDDLYNRFFNRTIMSCFDLNDLAFEEYVKKLNYINKKNPCVLVSYVNPIFQFAIWLKNNKKLNYSPESIITGAEPLHDYQREEIEKVFACKVFNSYGCREVMLIASECEKHSGMHINIDHLVAESVNNKGDVVKNVTGELSITDLHNYAMPFIRYKNEDLVSINETQCSCGRGLPIMSKVEGRVLDCIKTVNGNILPGEFFPHFFKDFRGIQEFQVVQDRLEKLDIYIIKNVEFSLNDENSISVEICKILGEKIDIRFHYVDDIPLTKSGKRRVTISNIRL